MFLSRNGIIKRVGWRKSLIFLFLLLVIGGAGIFAAPHPVQAEPLAVTFDCTTQATISFEDCNLLVAFYNDTGGETTWTTTTNWFNTDPCTWYGISCGGGTPPYPVTGISLAGNNLTGSIPTYMGTLSDLITLSLFSNSLSGGIPTELGSLSNLASLNLSINSLDGSIPASLGSLSNLTYLAISNNSLSGGIPTELGDLSNLTSLMMSNNSLTGSIPTSLGSLSFLNILDLGTNSLDGGIPAEFAGLTSLAGLYLNGNNLTGPIPAALGSLSTLEALYLQYNNLTGSIPPELGSLGSLIDLSLNGNMLEGFLPSELGSATALVNLDLSSNAALTGPLPLSFTNLTSLTNFSFIFTGICEPADSTLQSWLSGLTILSTTGVGCTDICATQSDIPQAECEALADIYFSTGGESWTTKTNWFDPNPCTWNGVTCTGGYVTTIDLNTNNLAGPIPATIDTFSNLEYLILNNNALTGSIPTEVGNLANLLHLYLQYNQLDGSLPVSLGSLANLSRLMVSINQLTGEVPPELGNLSNLQYLLISSNLFTGPLPQTLTNLSSLAFLYFGDTSICEPQNPSFQAWLSGVSSVSRSGISCSEFCTTQTDIPVVQCEALADLYYQAVGDSWTDHTNWLDNFPCTWFGVTCTTGNVTTVNLSSNNLVGSIPATLSEATSLLTLNFDTNHLSGEIPAELGSLSNLEVLSMHSNELTGFVPSELGNAAALVWLRFSDNLLEGPLPLSFTNLTNLDYFYYNINDICEPADTALQSWLAGLTTWVGTSVDCATVCAVQSSIPLAECDALQDFYFSTVGESWTTKTDWFSADPCDWHGVNCTGGYVNYINLLDNNLAGSLPASLNTFTTLYNLNLSTNGLTGSIPAEMGSITSLYYLYLGDNQLSGSVPTELGSLWNLNKLVLSNNSLTGPLPASLGSLGNLSWLMLDNNLLDGELPPELGNITLLEWLYLDHNLFTGPLPLNFSNLTSLNTFIYNNTTLCEPQDSAFQVWLTGIPFRSGTGVPCSTTLFVDDFETGDFSLWTRFNDGNGYLYPCHVAAINGSWGACVDRGTDKRKQLIDETPVNQIAYNVRFNIDINSLSMTVGTRFRFMQVKMGAERPFFIVLKYQGGQYLIQLNTLLNDLTKVKSGWYPLSNAPHTIEVDWAAATAPAANDGSAAIYLDDVLLETLASLDNDTIFVDTFKIGFTSRLDGKAISGIFYLDDIATSNSVHIGPP